MGIDQATKWLAVQRLGPGASDDRVELLGRVFAFEYLENTGAAFGVLEGQGLLLTLAAVGVVAVMLAYYVRSGRSSMLLATSLGLLVGGALGNVVDRVRLGYVVDFVAVGIWPKFNIADSAVSIGVLLLAWMMVREPERSPGSEDGHVSGERLSVEGLNALPMRKVSQHEGG